MLCTKLACVVNNVPNKRLELDRRNLVVHGEAVKEVVELCRKKVVEQLS
jgi:hypothetical protein